MCESEWRYNLVRTRYINMNLISATHSLAHQIQKYIKYIRNISRSSSSSSILINSCETKINCFKSINEPALLFYNFT